MYFTGHCQQHPWYKEWVNNDYIVTASVLNVRESGSKKAKVLDQIPLGTSVLSLELTIPPNQAQEDLQYYRIEYNKDSIIQKGYVHTNFLTQFYIYDRDELIFLKKEKSSDENTPFSINSLRNGVKREIGVIDTYQFHDFIIRVRYIESIESVYRLIEIKYEEYDQCEGGYIIHPFVEMINGQFVPLPTYLKDSGGEPGLENSIEMRLPYETYGEANRFVYVEYSFENVGFGTKVSEVRKVYFLEWIGEEFMKTDY